MRTISALLALFGMQSVLPLRHRSQRFFGGAFVAPFRHDQAHAHIALDRSNDVDGAADRPPAVARLLHEAGALEPPSLGERRGVAAEATARQLEAEQREPILEPQQADEPPAPGNLPPLPAERARRTPQRQGIESGNDDAALGPQDALGLAQERVRLSAEFQHVRQGQQVDALRRERQLHRLGTQTAAWLEPGADLERDARLAQEVQARKSELHRVVAEHVLDRRIELPALPGEDVAALGSLEPIG